MKKIIFTPTGETRPPKKGEWFFSNADEFKQAEEDYGYNSFPIYTRTEEEYTWRPEEGEPYWYCTSTFEAEYTLYTTYSSDITRVKIGNAFPTKEACETFIKEKGLR